MKTTCRAEAFGKYIKALRDASGGSLRSIAPRLGISFPHLGRMERGEVKKRPSIHFLIRMASVYDVPVEGLMEQAGIRADLLGRAEQLPTAEEQFEWLMLAPEFIPRGMDTEHLPHFPPLHRVLIQQLAENVERHTERRVRWELRGEADAPCPEPVSMRTLAEIIGVAAVRGPSRSPQ